MINDHIIVIMPVYNPSIYTVRLCERLIVEYKYIIIVDDGSEKRYNHYFNKIKTLGEIGWLFHDINMGKGKAIKDAIKYGLKTYDKEISSGKIIGFITCDADGQHDVKDIKEISSKLCEEEYDLILGSRNFDNNTPLRSKFGNELTSKVLNFVHHIKLNDTQTGLRCFNIEFARNIQDIFGSRYEFEINMLIFAKRNNYRILEKKIQTIYIDDNAHSHFNPILDSIKIYMVILYELIQYCFVSLFSFICDFVMFCLISKLTLKYNHYILYSTVIARFFSSLINFLLNAHIVFKKKNINYKNIFKYYLLVIINMFLSAFLVSFFKKSFNGNLYTIKVIVDTSIFIIIYFINKYVVFFR